MESENGENKELGNWGEKPTPSLSPQEDGARQEGNKLESASEENPPYPPLEKGETPDPLLQRGKSGVLKKIGWGIAALVLTVGLVQVLVADKYQAQVLVIEGKGKVGVNPTAEKLDFGDLSGDTSAARYITLNAGGMDTYIYIWKFGSIAELMKLNDNNFTMEKGDEKKLELSVYMPLSAPVGEKYTGRVWIFKVPRVW